MISFIFYTFLNFRKKLVDRYFKIQTIKTTTVYLVRQLQLLRSETHKQHRL